MDARICSKKARGKPEWSSLNTGRQATVSAKQSHELRDEGSSNYPAN